MKTKRTIFRVLSFVLLLVVMATVIFLTGCEEKATQGEVDTLKTNVASDVDTVKTDLIKTQDSLNAAQSDIAKLVADLNNLAEASATKAGLTDEAAALQAEYTALDAKIAALTDAAATKAQLEADKAALQAEIDALSANAATKEALEAQKEALDTQIAALTDAAATKAQLEADKAALQAEITANKQLIEGINTTIQALSSTVTSGMASLNTAIGGLSTRVSALETNSATKTELTNEVNALTQQITNINNTINSFATIEKLNEEKAALQAKIDDLQAQINDLATQESLEAATAELNAAIAKLQDLQNANAEVINTLYEGDFSIEAFRDKVNNVDPKDYSDKDYADFKKAANKLEFILGRAVVVETTDETLIPYSVKGIFAELDKLIAELPTLEAGLVAEMNAIEENGGVTLADGQLDTLNAIHGKLVTNGIADAAWETTSENGIRYNAFVAARTRLEAAAADAAAANAKIALLPEKDAVVYAASDAAVAEIKADYEAIAATYFADEKMTALYGITIEDLDGYVTYTEYQEIVDHLNAAKAALDAIELATLEKYITLNPLFSDLDDINADFALIADWAEEFDLNPAGANYATIIDASKGATTGDLARMNAVKAYAEAMKAIYDDNEVETLVANFRAEIEKGVDGVAYTNLATLFGYYDARADVETLIAAVDGYDALTDGNAAAMFDFSDEEKTALADILDRANTIDAAAVAVAALNVDVAAKIGNVTYADGGETGSINNFKNALAAIFTSRALPTDDLNYKIITGVLNADGTEPETENSFVAGSIKDNLAQLDEEYFGLTKKVQDVYDTVKGTVHNATDNSLADLQKIIWARNTISELEVDAIISTTDFTLKNGDDEITYADFIVALDAKLSALVKLAEAAETDASTVGGVIDQIAAVNADEFDLNKSADFKTVVDNFMAWAETYLGIAKPDVLNGENVKAYLASLAPYFDNADEKGENNAILGIINYVTETDMYNFVPKASYENVVAIADVLIETRAAANSEWTEILADFAALPDFDDITIHDAAFETAKTRYDAYVTDFYADTITNAQYDELTVYAAFATDYSQYNTLCAAAEALYDEIIADATALNALGNPADATEADDMHATAVALKVKVDNYHVSFCEGNTDDCEDQCKLIAGNLDAALVAYKAEAKALMRQAYEEHRCNDKMDAATLATQFKKVNTSTSIEAVVEGAYNYFNGQYVAVAPVDMFAPAV